MNVLVFNSVVFLLTFGNVCNAAKAITPQQSGGVAKPGIGPLAGGATVKSGFETQLATIEGKLKALESNLIQLQTTVNLSNSFRQNQEWQINVLTEMMKRQKAWLIDMKSFMTKPMKTNTPDDTTTIPAGKSHCNPKGSVAFTAFLDKDMNAIGADQTLIFNKVILNEGGAYNDATGVFTCPQAGLYDFSFVIGQRDKKGVWAKLMVNKDAMVAASADAEHPYQDIQGGNRVFVRLNVGDVVRVVLHSGAAHVEGDTQRFTTFSGVFVSP